MGPTIRLERSGDEASIRELTDLAFEPMSFSDGTEGPIIDDLRREGDLTLSLVATLAEKIVGHIAFSPVTIDGRRGAWIGMGPVSVRPDLQGQGIGAALIAEGMAMIRSKGASGCVLTGDPRYYRRFGFRSSGSLFYRSLPEQFVQAVSFGDEDAAGILAFSPAFERR